MPGEEERRLYRDAMTLSVNKNLDDVTTLLQWAHEAATPEEKLQHIRQAMALLEDVRHILEEQSGASPRT